MQRRMTSKTPLTATAFASPVLLPCCYTTANALHVGNTLGAQAMRVSGLGGGIVNFQDTNAAPEQRLYQWRSEGGLFRMSLLNDSESTFAQQNLLVANASGNIGIGTASPTS